MVRCGREDITMPKVRTLLLATLSVAVLAACDQPAEKRPAPPPGPPVPPSPDLPMTAAKAREIVAGLPLPCTSLASLKMAMLTCDERVNRPADHAALRTELRDLAWNLQKVGREEQIARCTQIEEDLRRAPKPQACWDL